MYTIIGVFNGEREELDTAETKTEAVFLCYEYKAAFGNSWKIYFKHN